MKVSVLMPVYNGAKYLRPAVGSILSQTLEDFELLVVDDGSADQTLEILQSYQDKRLKIISNDQNRGVAHSLNRALDQAEGKYIVRMDSDDIAYPRRLEKQVAFLEQNPDIDLCGSSVNQFGVKKGVCHYPETHAGIEVQHLFNPAFIHSAVCWRRKALEKNHYRYQEIPPTAEDYELWVRVGEHHRMANMQEPLIHYRVDPQIKISAYIQQQLDGAKQVRERMLSCWVESISKSEMELHHKISEGLHPLSVVELRSAMVWLNKIIDLNQNNARFDALELEKRCSQYAYVLLVSHRNLHGLSEAMSCIKSCKYLHLSFLQSLKLLIRRVVF